MMKSWIKGLLKQRWGRLMGSICGAALTIALLASISTFIAFSGASMTKRAIKDIPVDWQVKIVPGTDVQTIQTAVGKTTPYTNMETVGYADAAGFETATGGTVQTTGQGKVLGISGKYIGQFQGEIRLLNGTLDGVMVAQQTAANLHVKVGDMVNIMRIGMDPVSVKVDGIVDLPNADSLFQAIGLPSGAAPQAPPDNVLLLPIDQWHKIFDEQAAARPDSVYNELHVRIAHNFDADPNTAYTFVKSESKNLEARIAGSGIVGDNIAARLDSVRSDAFYSRILFLFLGLPGVILAILLTLFITVSGAKHRMKEQALLRVQGASSSQILKLESLEALTVGVFSVILGIVLTYIINKLIIPGSFALGSQAFLWTAVSSAVGFIIAMAAVLYPAWRQAKYSTVQSAKSERKATKPLWQRFYFDIAMLAVSAIEFWRTASSGYQIVLAPEGITAVSVNYEAFIAPFFLWIGGVLLAVRISKFSLDSGNNVLAWAINPIAKRLSGLVAASILRERAFLVRGVILVALAVSFAVSTSIFNTTYNSQSHVDAELTNGSDVTVTGYAPFQKGDKKITELRKLPESAGMQLMQHRFAYVGNDLQDIYGIDSSHITESTNISDAYFAMGDAKTTLKALGAQKDGVLVSEETVKDFQLKVGDQINLRIQSSIDHQYHAIPFHFVGIVRKFPTAPSDSFLVANADYISQMSGNSGSEIILMRSSNSPQELAKRVKEIVGSNIGKVSDIGSTQQAINSSLTSVDLHGLTALELVFAALLVAGAVGLVLALGMAERRRNFAILQALGAKKNQLGAFIWSEGLTMLFCGSTIGILLGIGVAWMLVKVLTGVFDPPPQVLSVPWGYLAVLAAAAVLSTVFAVNMIKAASRRPAVEELRNL